MQRILMDKLVAWKDDPDRKPLLLQGAKHCGKTFLLKEFGEKYFGNVLYFDFSQDSRIADLFDSSSEPHRIIKDLSIFLEKDINPDDTLIILDEIHLCPSAVDSLRHFCDMARQYYIASASSYIGVALPHGMSIPIGKSDLLTLFPMNFYEFLLAQSPMLALHLKESGLSGEPYKTFHKQLEEKFLDYQIVGGMPEVVSSWIELKSIETVDKIQNQIIKSIESDFAGLCTAPMLPKLIAIWNAIPVQLVKGNSKFMFSKVKKSWRGKDLDDAIYWLMRAGLIYKVEHVEKPDIPVSGYVNPAHFKLYMCDVGLLRRIGAFPSSMIMSRPAMPAESSATAIKNAVVENIVCCELMRIYERELYYWSAENPGKAEVDFIVQDGETLIPIEVKIGSTGRARSLSQYRMRFSPKKYVLTGMDNDKDDVLPLYAFWDLSEWLKARPFK